MHSTHICTFEGILVKFSLKKYYFKRKKSRFLLGLITAHSHSRFIQSLRSGSNWEEKNKSIASKNGSGHALPFSSGLPTSGSNIIQSEPIRLAMSDKVVLMRKPVGGRQRE